MSTKFRSSLLVILFFAFALRVYRLDAQSIWYDEGLSIQLAQLPPDQTISLSATTDHPPLHALLLGGWIRIAGDSDFMVRFLSVFFGVLSVALIYKLGKLFDERAGLIAAGLMSIAPMAVYYSQETRGYMLLTVLILIAALAFVRLLSGVNDRRTWLIYGAAIVGALYTHYFAAFAWAAFNAVYSLIVLGQRLLHRRAAKAQVNTPSFLHTTKTTVFRAAASARYSYWIIVQIVIAICFLPWLPNAIAQASSNATYFPGRVTWDTVFGDTWRAFTVGEWGGGPIAGWAWLVLIAVGAAVLIYSRGTKIWEMIITLVAWLIVPLLLMSALAWLKPKFAPRYLLPSLPAFILLGSIGLTRFIAGLKSRLCTLASIGVVASLILPLADSSSLLQLYTDPAIARPDVRSVVTYIQAHEQPSDAIILIGGHQAPAFNHYYHGANEVIPLPPDLLPSPQNPIDARAIGQLADIALKHPRVWLVLWQSEISDPMDLIKDILSEQAQRLDVGQNFHDMALQLFDVRSARFAEEPQFSVDYRFVHDICLVGYNVNTLQPNAGTPLAFGLYFTSDDLITGNYQIFTHLIGPAGSTVVQQDHIAGADSYPTSLWHPGNLILNRFKIDLPSDLALGEYQIEVGLYDSSGRLRLIDGSDHINLMQLTVNR